MEEVRLGSKHNRDVDSTSEEKFDANAAGTFKTPSRQPPAQINASCIFAETQQLTPSTSATSVLGSEQPASSEVLKTIEQMQRQKVERGPTFSRPAARLPSSALTSTFATNGRFITLTPSPNSRVAHSNEYEKRLRYSYLGDGPRAQLPRPENAAVARATRDH